MYIRRYQVAITPNPSAIRGLSDLRYPRTKRLVQKLVGLGARPKGAAETENANEILPDCRGTSGTPFLQRCHRAGNTGANPEPEPDVAAWPGNGFDGFPDHSSRRHRTRVPRISPAPTGVTGTIAMPGSTTSCSTVGISPSTMSGSTSTYDGGGLAVGGATPAAAATSGMSTSGICGSGSGSVAASSAPTPMSPTTTGGLAQTGIPLGSTEIGNLGVSSAVPVPITGVSPTTGSVTTSVAPMAPSVSSPP